MTLKRLNGTMMIDHEQLHEVSSKEREVGH